MADTLPSPSTLLPWGHPDYRHPGPADVRAVARLLDLSEDALASLVGAYDGSAVRRWLAEPGSKKAGAIRYPTWRLMLLEARLVSLAPRRPARAKPLRPTKENRSKRPIMKSAAGNKESGLEAPGHPQQEQEHGIRK